MCLPLSTRTSIHSPSEAAELTGKGKSNRTTQVSEQKNFLANTHSAAGCTAGLIYNFFTLHYLPLLPSAAAGLSKSGCLAVKERLFGCQRAAVCLSKKGCLAVKERMLKCDGKDHEVVFSVQSDTVAT